VKTILVVDDEFTIVEALLHLLEEEEGYSVITAGDGQEALDLALASQHRLDLVVTDLMMPHMSGTELFLAMRKRPALAKVPVILMTSAPMAAPRNLRWADLIVKPFEFDELARAIRRALGDRKPRDLRNRRASPRQRRRFKVKIGPGASFTIDVSPKGFATEAMRVLSAGSAVRGSIEARGRTVSFEGRVVWSTPGDASLGVRGRMGISFTSASRELLELLQTA
jgi:CheY-like chemotaxis protein